MREEASVIYGAQAFYADPAVVQDLATGLAALARADLAQVMLAHGIDPRLYEGREDAAVAAQVAVMLAGPQNIAATVHQLSSRELATLRAIWRRGPVIPREQIAAMLGGVLDQEPLAQTLGRLQALALALPADATERELYVPAAVRGVLAGNHGAPRPIGLLFGSLSGATLGVMADELAIDPVPKRKDDRLAAVLTALKTPAAIERQLAALTDEEREILTYVVRRNAATEPYRIVQRFPQALGSSWTYSYNYFLRGEQVQGRLPPLLRLQARGLLAPYPPGYPSVIVVPDEVLTARLPPFQITPSDFIEPPLTPPRADAQPVASVTAPALDLLDALRFVEDAKLTLTKQGLLPKPQRLRLAKLIAPASPVYADFIEALAIQAGILKSDLGLRLLQQSKALDALLALDDRDSRAALLQFWLDLHGWYDAAAEPYLRGETYLSTQPAERRVALRLLAELPPEGASLASLAARLRYRHPQRFDEEDRGQAPPAAGEKPGATGFLLGVLRVLAWLGLAEPLTFVPQPGEPAETVGLRLTPLGRDVVATESGLPVSTPAETVPRTDRIVVQPTLDVLAPPNVEPCVYRDLLRFSDLVRAGGMRTLTISATSLRRALDAGARPESVRAFLEQHGEQHGGDLPATVASLIAEAAARYGRIHTGQAGLYLTVDEPHLLAELRADRRLADLNLRELAPTVAVASEMTVPVMLERLRAVGHMPVADGDLAPRDPFAPPRHAPSATKKPAAPAASSDEVDPSIYATLERGFEAGKQVELTYHRRGKSVQPPFIEHHLSVYELIPDEVYGRCWDCNTSVRLKIARITKARVTGEPD